MINVRVGDLFSSDAQTLVNTVNCVGVMGKGIALEFKKRFPEMYRDYEDRCRQGLVRLGRPYLYKQLVGPCILNFPTKQDWRSVSRLKDIVAGLEYLEQNYRAWGITSLAVPPLGCGQGGLDWRVVGPTLFRHLSRLDIPVELFAPHGTPERELTPDFLSNAPADTLVGAGAPAGAKIDPALVALVEIAARIERERYRWPVGRTTFQKIAYFATASGIPTGLRFERGSYGPYAAGLKNAMTRLVNNGLIDEEPHGRMLEIKPGETFADAREVYRGRLSAWSQPIDRVADLFLRIPTRDAELLATVHFAAQELSRGRELQPSELDVVEAVKQWKQLRRPPFSDEQIASAIRSLNVLGWVDVRPSPELDPKDEEVALA